MSKSYCSKCDAPIEGDVGFCSHCGNRISENAMADTVQQVPKTVAKKAKRNPFAKFIFITIATQILFLILSGMLIRSFVLKFEKPGLLNSTRYGNRTKYAVRISE